MVKSDIEFIVVDAKSGEDITRSVLTQIIFEEESKGQNLLPISFLRQLIGFYGDSLQSIIPNYLESSMNAFTQNQEAMRSYVTEAMGGMFPFAGWEELGKQNMAMFERAMKMFSPFGAVAEGRSKADAKDEPEGEGDDVADLKSQLEALQKKVDNLSQRRRGGTGDKS